MTAEELKKQVNNLIDQYVAEQPTITVGKPVTAEELDNPPKRTDGKRAARTKSTGDRVYLVDDNAKTKAWVTTADILAKLGFEMADVIDMEDSELSNYQMAPSIYRVDE